MVSSCFCILLVGFFLLDARGMVFRGSKSQQKKPSISSFFFQYVLNKSITLSRRKHNWYHVTGNALLFSPKSGSASGFEMVLIDVFSKKFKSLHFIAHACSYYWGFKWGVQKGDHFTYFLMRAPSLKVSGKYPNTG